jgi:CheY-like chemotaxis protein
MLMVSGSALVVDRAVVSRHLVSRFLTNRYEQVESAPTIEEARVACAIAHPSLVVLDATVEGAFDWFSEWTTRSPKPAFLVATSRPSSLEETRFTLGGAIGYLAKPISFHRLLEALATASPCVHEAAPRVRVLPLAEVTLQDPSSRDHEVTCEVRDLGMHGAFVAAAAPIPVGTPLRLCLRLGRKRVSLRARVARIQEPAWGVTPGWGVSFDRAGDEALRIVHEFVQQQLAGDTADAPAAPTAVVR